MIEIMVKICGDHWLNAEEVEQQLRQLRPDIDVMINMSTEGASMRALGVDRMIDSYLDPGRVTVCAWANSVESVPYHRAEQHLYSHFFWMAQRYWHAEVPSGPGEKLFACLIGRLTWPRVRMLMDLQQDAGQDCLFSLMESHGRPRDHEHNLDRRSDWMHGTADPHQSLMGLGSIDGRRVQDQYDPEHNTNLSILRHYHRFDIEIVAETYCHGCCFFPTEKTVRPLLYRKPIMVYGPRHFLRRLREQGFRTWSDWWDESYDDLVGPARWQAMLQQIRMLATCGHFDQIRQDYQDILDHNRDRTRVIGSRHRPG